MDVSMRKCLCLLMCILASSTASSRATPSSSTCQRQLIFFLHDLNLMCPLTMPFSSPIMVDGVSFEEIISSSQQNEFTAILFYASWCPFSNIFVSQFSTLSSMYPQIKHLMFEQSSAMPSVFSRYGIHSVPSLLIVHQTKPTRYHGPKDLQSVMNFYKRTTGTYPVIDMVEDASNHSESNPKIFDLFHRASLKETFSREPYLVLSSVFVLSKALLYIFQKIASFVLALWVAYIPRLNLGIFGESRQLLGRVCHQIDIKRIWSKTRNLHKGARNARVLASSLASVSLGETSLFRRLVK